MTPPRVRAALSLMLGAALLALAPSGCASGLRTRRFPSAIFRSARHVGNHSVQNPQRVPNLPRWASAGDPPTPDARLAHRTPPGDETSALIVERIRAAGFRFGTDGTPGALWGYMRTSHELVDPRDARAGDVVFFDTRSRGEEELDCSDRVGLIESVDGAGRITFLESRGGQLYRGYVDARQPLARRDERGEIVNSFLRPKRLGDADGTRYFAGEMLCGIARVHGQ
jgi:hypothetical protein